MTIFANSDLVNAYRITLFRVVVGTLLSLALTALTGFALSRRRLPFRRFFNWMIFVPLYFSGGLIPYSQQWNVTLEHQFGDRILVSAAYVGSKVTHMYDSLSVNGVDPAYYKLGATTLNSLITSPAAQAAGWAEKV